MSGRGNNRSAIAVAGIRARGCRGAAAARRQQAAQAPRAARVGLGVRLPAGNGGQVPLGAALAALMPAVAQVSQGQENGGAEDPLPPAGPGALAANGDVVGLLTAMLARLGSIDTHVNTIEADLKQVKERTAQGAQVRPTMWLERANMAKLMTLVVKLAAGENLFPNYIDRMKLTYVHTGFTFPKLVGNTTFMPMDAEQAPVCSELLKAIGADIRQVRYGVKAVVMRLLRNLPWVPEDIEDEDEGEDEEEPPSLYFNHNGSPTAAAGKALSSGSWRKVEHEDGTVDDFGSPLVLNIIQGLAPGLWKKVPVAAPDAFAIYTSPAVAAFISAVVEAELSGTSWRSFTDGERDHHCRSRTKVIIEEWESDHVRDLPSPFADIPANEDGSGEDASEQDEDMDE